VCAKRSERRSVHAMYYRICRGTSYELIVSASLVTRRQQDLVMNPERLSRHMPALGSVYSISAGASIYRFAPACSRTAAETSLLGATQRLDILR
jgi:hypothetical protein